MHDRRRVRCWVCGRTARRVPNSRGLKTLPDGRMGVVGRKRTVQPYGRCNAPRWSAFDAVRSGGRVDSRSTGCDGIMLRRADALFVLRAALAHERRGGNDL